MQEIFGSSDREDLIVGGGCDRGDVHDFDTWVNEISICSIPVDVHDTITVIFIASKIKYN